MNYNGPFCHFFSVRQGQNSGFTINNNLFQNAIFGQNAHHHGKMWWFIKKTQGRMIVLAAKNTTQAQSPPLRSRTGQSEQEVQWNTNNSLKRHESHPRIFFACGRMLYVFAICKYLHCINQGSWDSESVGEYNCNGEEEVEEISIHVGTVGGLIRISLW